MSTPANRIDYLDSARGLAALSVVFYHVLEGTMSGKPAGHIISMFLNGADAVSFFFVLSGFVLTFKYFRDKKAPSVLIPWRPFVISRVFRLYPPFIITLLIYYFYANRHDIGSWPSDILLNSHQFWNEAILLRGHNTLNAADWSLGIEVAISLFIPIIIVLARVNIKTLYYLSFVVLAVPGHFSPFLLHFLLGAILSYYYEDIRDYDFKASRYHKYRYWIYLAVFLLFSGRHIARMVTQPQWWKEIWEDILGVDMFTYSGIASFLIIAFIINSAKLQRVLLFKPFVFLGRISYSLYLIQGLIVWFVLGPHYQEHLAWLGHPSYVYLFWLAIVVPASILSAWILYELTEKPFMKLGKRIAARYKTSS